jgi:DNA-binding beta-propeller fold protein YncE
MSNPTWLNVPGAGAYSLAIFNGFVYVSSYYSGRIRKFNETTGTIVDASWHQISAPLDLVIDPSGTFMYAISGGHTTIFKINVSTGSAIKFNFVPGISNPIGIVIDATGTFMYTSSWNGTITKINVSNGSIVNANWVSGLNQPHGLTIDPAGQYMYVSDTGNNRICKINMSNGSFVNANWVTGITSPLYLAIDNSGTFIYVSSAATQSIRKITLYDGTFMGANYISGLDSPYKLIIKGNYIHVAEMNANRVGRYIVSASVPCFKKDTKILTHKGYRLIQDLKKGDLVKTLKNGYKQIDIIYTTKMYHPSLPERTKEQLYKCSQSEYPDLFEPLVITGNHSILVDEFSNEEQRQKTIEMLGKVYVTDTKYRLPACVDPRASVYETEGIYNVYHLALENNISYMNYAIYANGLLVETCSKKILNEFLKIDMSNEIVESKQILWDPYQLSPVANIE